MADKAGGREVAKGLRARLKRPKKRSASEQAHSIRAGGRPFAKRCALAPGP